MDENSPVGEPAITDQNTDSIENLAEHFGLLRDHQYASLSTFRKDGTAVPTAVWFAESEGRLYITTVEGTGKVKRIRNNSSVTVAPCTRTGKALGAAVGGTARILEGDEAETAERLLQKKYGLQYRAMGAVRKVAGRDRENIFLEVAPI